jgi:septum formation protein
VRLVLASGSPRRRDLMTLLRVPFHVAPSSVTERMPIEGEDAARYATELASEKAHDVADRHPDDLVLGADTVVVIDGEILGKPTDRAHAVEMLRKLRGRSHVVITGVAVIRGTTECTDFVAAEVRMREFSPGDMERYIDTGEPMDKAGAYAVQGLGGSLVESVAGCYNAVVGLPLCVVQELLRKGGMSVQRTACRHS